MDDFLSEDNAAGQAALWLVSRGNAIIAELLRLSDHVPDVFYLSSKRDVAKYGDILFDFKYLKSQEYYEHQIESSYELLELDEEFRENHMEILERFFVMFESIYKYISEFTRYLQDLEEGVYIQQSIETILFDTDGKQLMAEALYLFGVMLTVLDLRIPGQVRERLLISYYRYKGQQGVTNMDEVCNLCRSTGFELGKNPPKNYPESYFARFEIPTEVVEIILGRLRSDDIYNQMNSYPSPSHRSTALASQACMIYIILYFVPNVLKKENAIMREIVDKHFQDNWVFSFYMGFTVDLSDTWAGYKAAKAALKNTINIGNVKDLQAKHMDIMFEAQDLLDKYLTEGVLIEEYVLDHITPLLNCLRKCNVTLRWLMLHATTKTKKLREAVVADLDPDQLLKLLLDTAQFEFVLKNMFKDLLMAKQDRWDQAKEDGSSRMLELSEYFSGTKALTKDVEKDETFMTWFKEISEQIDSLDFNDSTLAGRKMQKLISALEEVEQYHQVGNELVKHYLEATRKSLHAMIRTVNIKEEVLVTISLVADMSYAWQIINDYVELMQIRIKRDPSTVIKLRSTFLKLASILEIPLIRIAQAKSPDVDSVAEYYSSELVAYVRKVLEIIPRSMFDIMSEIIQLQTHVLVVLPTRLEKAHVKEYAQLDSRYKLAKLTHQISVFTEGILAMNTTLVGIIKVDPKQLLEDGIRKELVNQISYALDSTLIFGSGKVEDFEKRLQMLADTLDGYRRSFEYISDYVNIYGLKIWQEEFSRIINYNIEQECNSFLKQKVWDWQSEYQSEAIPIPVYPPMDDSVNFVGRLSRELLSLTDSRYTVYCDQMSAWLDKSGKEIVGIRSFSLLHESVGTFGLTGVDRLFSFMIVGQLQNFVSIYQRQLGKKELAFLEDFGESLLPLSNVIPSAQKYYQSALTKTKKWWSPFVEVIMNIGQVQLIRRAIATELNFSCKLDSNSLASTLDTLNRSVLADIEEHYRNPEDNPYPEKDNELLPELTKYLETSGVYTPFNKIYITTETLPDIETFMFLMTLAQMAHFSYEEILGTLVAPKKNSVLDGAAFIVGVITVLKQFHSSLTQDYLAMIGQYVRGTINSVFQKDPKPTDYPDNILNLLIFLDDFIRHSGFSKKTVEGYLPAYISDTKMAHSIPNK